MSSAARRRRTPWAWTPPELLTTDQLIAEAEQLLWQEADARRRTGKRTWPTVGAMTRTLDPEYRSAPHLELLDRELVALMDDPDHPGGLLWSMPPQEGKSQKISRRFVVWLLQHDPTLRIGLVSHTLELARDFARQARRDVIANPQLGIRLAPDLQQADHWQTVEGGGVHAFGVGGAITGNPVDVLVIDDPISGRADAESATMRNKLWGWWESDGSTRLSGRSRRIVLMTRWHEDDLHGRLLKREPGKWRHVNVPAIAESPDDPLGRAIGEELPSVRGRPPGYFHDLQRTRTPYVFRAIFQGNPTAAQGNVFLRDRWRFWRLLAHSEQGPALKLGEHRTPLQDTWRFATVDLAASTRTSADYTVVSAWALALTGDLVLLDRARRRAAAGEHAGMVRPLVERWGLDMVYVERSFQDSTLIRDLATAGVATDGLDADSDKLTRALPYAARVNAGRVWLPAHAEWTEEWISEHAEFPTSSHDDQVDTGSYAARVASVRWAPLAVLSGATTAPRTTPGELDLMRQEW